MPHYENSRPKLVLDHVIVTGYNKKGDVVISDKARVKKDGQWVSPKSLKKELKNRFVAIDYFKRQNIWRRVSAA